MIYIKIKKNEIKKIVQLFSFFPKIFVCVLLFSQADLAGGEGTGDPQQVESLEGDQHKANVGRQVFGTLWVHEVVCGSAAGILFIPYSGSQVHPGTHRSN